MKISAARMTEILSDALPSCGTDAAARMPADALIEAIVCMTAAEWRALSPEPSTGA